MLFAPEFKPLESLTGAEPFYRHLDTCQAPFAHPMERLCPRAIYETVYRIELLR
jgi:hypothetical protein